jgi:hypothetical protein
VFDSGFGRRLIDPQRFAGAIRTDDGGRHTDATRVMG